MNSEKLETIMRGSGKFFQRGSNSDNLYLVDEGREFQKTTRSGPLSARQRNAIKMAFRWRAYNDPTWNSGLAFQRIQTSIAKKPYTLPPIYLSLSNSRWKRIENARKTH